MRRINRLLCPVVLTTMMFFVVACKPGVPRQYIQPGQLEDILYDFHIADGMASVEGNYSEMPFRRLAYREAVLRKHKVTKAEFDSSLVYYYRHTERLHEIYQNLAKRLDSEAVALGASANELSQFGGITSQGDTATVWNYRQTAVLFPQAPYNTISFDVKADTAYHPGDKMILTFDAKFIYQEGARNGTAYLAVTYDNDSTATQVMHVSADMHYNLQLSSNKDVGIKTVRGFIHLGRESTNSPSLKMMAVTNMRLMRMHTDQVDSSDEDDEEKDHGTRNGSIPVNRMPVPDNPGASVNMRPQVNDADVPSHARPVSAPPSQGNNSNSPTPQGQAPNGPGPHGIIPRNPHD